MFKSKSVLDVKSSKPFEGDLRKSYSLGNCTIEKQRGFKPSDCHDPGKRDFLLKLSQQIWQKNQETSNTTKQIDLQKIFTPATDAEELLPKNRKLYASSAFYSPTLHPTVEDQVELARRISHSLSDIGNQQSKGQSMYVNRKKRSVKWVHEGPAGEETYEEFLEQQQKENDEIDVSKEQEIIKAPLEKLPLRLLMNPRGEVRDYNSMRDSLNIETGLLSPEKCAELVTALQTQKGKGAELFAKRRKKADKWVVDDTNASTHSPSGLPDFHPYQAMPPKPPTSPSILPAYSDAGKHRVQLNIHQEQVLEKYAKPGLKVVKSPWEAALETGSASTAFMEDSKQQHQHLITPTPSPALQTSSNSAYNTSTFIGNQSPQLQQRSVYKPSSYNDHQKDLAYKPSVPQGWKAPSVSLPKDGDLLYLENIMPRDKSTCISDYYYEETDPSCDTDLEIIGYNLRKIKESPTDFKNKIKEAPPNKSQQQENLEYVDKEYEPVDVRKQLKELECQQRKIASLKEIEENRENQRNRNQQKWKYQEKFEYPKQNADAVNSLREMQHEAEEGYIKVAVRDLIQNFEQQTNLEEVLTVNVSTSPELTDLNLPNEELYMPKEIPLESYAPPPVIDIGPSKNFSPYPSSQPQNSHTWNPTASTTTYSPISNSNLKCNAESNFTSDSSSFPLSNRHLLSGNGYEESNNFPTLRNEPPKQQYWEPTSYQKITSSIATQKPPQVNFSPSPLSYEKLAKFENSEADPSYRQYSPPNQRYLTPNQNNRVRNVSPTPFGSPTAAQSQTYNVRFPVLSQSSSSQQYSPYMDNFNNNTYSPLIASSPACHFNTSQLLHAPSYNNSARGWQGGNNASRLYSKPLAPIITAGDMPYTDF